MIFDRVIRIAGRPGHVRVSLEDTVHHFRIDLRHDGMTVASVQSESPRHPFTLCPAAGGQLDALVGITLTEDVSEVTRQVNARQQCTHQFDAAIFAITAAARSTDRRCYRASIDVGDPKTVATLFRDDATVYRWEIDGDSIRDGGRFDGVGIGTGFTSFVSAHLDVQEGEAAFVLRRAVFVAIRHNMTLHMPAVRTASPRGGCWVQQPERAGTALRLASEDQAPLRDGLTRTDDAWLDFVELV